MFDVERGTLTRIVHGGDNHSPVWSPDSRRIVYERRTPPHAMVSLTIEGAREVQSLPLGSPKSWSGGGNLLAYTVDTRSTRTDIWVRAMDGSSPPIPFLATEYNEDNPSISPDGKWIAYTSDETGTPEVFIRPYPVSGVAWQVSAGGGGNPLWSRDGRELLFTSGTKLISVPITTRPALQVGAPVEISDGGISTFRSRDFDVAPDGRFVTVRHASGAGQNEMRVLLNWDKELERTARPAH
jgi:Tol biopolymer transport system component